MGVPSMTTDAPPVDVSASRGRITPGLTPLSPLNAVRARIVLGAICVLAALLYAWGIGTAGWGNPYYSAAVKSMSASLTNFVFGSFDPLGVVAVDKPPMALWPMVASAAVFGYHGWSLLLPQVIEGVAAVFLLHRTVRLWAGEHVALLAALVFAVTPVTVAINRDTNPDTLMVLLLVAAAYALSRALVSGKQCYNTVSHSRARRCATGWLLLAAVFLGLGFVTKMLQAWIVVPVFALAYLVGSPAPPSRRRTGRRRRYARWLRRPGYARWLRRPRPPRRWRHERRFGPHPPVRRADGRTDQLAAAVVPAGARCGRHCGGPAVAVRTGLGAGAPGWLDALGWLVAAGGAGAH